METNAGVRHGLLVGIMDLVPVPVPSRARSVVERSGIGFNGRFFVANEKRSQNRDRVTARRATLS